MAHHVDLNPFEEKEEVNPFSDPTVRAQGVTQSKYSGGSFYSTDTKKKEKELQAWEKRLQKKEEELKRREERLARVGLRVTLQEKNWPPVFPIIHNDIAKDIPPDAQRLMYLAFASFLGMVIYLIWNLLAATVALIKGYPVRILLFAIIYALVGCPWSYFLWYRPLYRGICTGSGVRFGFFTLLYLIYIGILIVSVVAAILFNEDSLVGPLSGLRILSKDTLVGLFYLIGFVLFCIETVLTLWVIQRVYRYFRSSGAPAEARHNAAQGAMNVSL